jgi:predicted RNA-binding protein
MCESSVYRIRKGEREKLMDNVTLITVSGEDITLSGILGERINVKGSIKSVDSEKHEVIIQ